MNLLGFLDDNDFVADAVQSMCPKDWFTRIAVRAVLQNDEGQITLMHVKKYDIYKLPGGGVEEEENLEIAFVREVEEETGFIAKAVADIGVFIEKRDEEKFMQISFCYLAKVIEKGEINLTEGEAEQEFELVWVDIDKAIKLVDRNVQEHYDVKYMTPRELAILKKAKEMLD